MINVQSTHNANSKFRIQNSKFFSPKNKAPKLINNEYKLTIEDLKLLTKN